ncbi:BamA/TamA family outer membrane protein [Lacinutrix sp. C3R15]|uniref:BamA/OMP85 family outer membrane protein n=1 Tax=Flavobacteriaceae TaxID=49546 RepID=UPI001C0847B0|nr:MULTISPECIES: POTRA domain-containing protein [Flavobacteriaceae]MBU2940037.1 BamA/TamA family outer membrane protein [Lacinutrix sp. C3R15]MDO6623354.1 POTRA domain-containing protein [Oceanihabitans sp. 1_MG-2023]
MPLKAITKHFLALTVTIFSLSTFAQETTFTKGNKYTIEEITVNGNTSFSEQTIITYSGLRKGSEVQIPGEEISNAIKKLWNSNLFNDIDIYLLKVEGNNAFLEIRLSDLPELNAVKITGVKKGKKETIIKENKLDKGVKVTENLITTTKNYLQNKYKKDGFTNAKVNINTIETSDSIQRSKVNMVLAIDKGKKVKVKDIVFTGNSVLTDSKLGSAMKNTKKRNFLRIYKRSKYIEEDYKTDLTSIIDKYKENGYRDARILSDSLIINNDNTITLNINLEEGEKYSFGDISFIGNTVYTDQQLKRVLRINKGETYNGVLLQERIADNSRPDAEDLTNLYQNNGYLFSTINPVETNAEGNVIDMEIRISEGKPTYFNNVTVHGNEVTNDKIIYRELRTRPGQLYSKANVVRTIRELSQLGFFDTEQITTDFKNPNPNEGTIDLQYGVVETGSSQIELQGGYGSGSFIGTLGLSFNNFSIKNILNRKAYKPVPRGDGQKLALRLQASRFYQTYSFSFTEPWLGGKKPVQFSTSISHSKQFLYDYTTGNADKDKRFNITGISVGLAKRLSVPDDYFTLSQALSYQHYNLKNYNTGLFTFGDGYSNNLAYTIGLSRNNTYNDPVYPTGGSNFNISAKLSIPYSLFNNVDYAALSDERAEQEEIYYDANGEYTDIQSTNAYTRMGEIDQERYKWLEFYKIKFKADWYTRIVDKLVLRPSLEFGFLGAYDNDRGVIPFERFFLGGDGLASYSLDGRETIALRGYENQSLQPVDEDGNVTSDGGSIYNKFSLELRYPITLKPAAKIYMLGFLEGGVSYNNFKDYNPFDLKRSAGLGLRLFMPAFGLLGIDFGYGFDSVPGQGTTVSGWQTHFIIGQQF